MKLFPVTTIGGQTHFINPELILSIHLEDMRKGNETRIVFNTGYAITVVGGPRDIAFKANAALSAERHLIEVSQESNDFNALIDASAITIVIPQGMPEKQGSIIYTDGRKINVKEDYEYVKSLLGVN